MVVCFQEVCRCIPSHKQIHLTHCSRSAVVCVCFGKYAIDLHLLPFFFLKDLLHAVTYTYARKCSGMLEIFYEDVCPLIQSYVRLSYGSDMQFLSRISYSLMMKASNRLQFERKLFHTDIPTKWSKIEYWEDIRLTKDPLKV